MNKIHILNNNLINKIAAGEVIERPASVVKELVDNSIDANATNIIIEIIAGGKELIKILDDGEGMSKHDLLTCTTRHATSKITTEQDLYNVSSMGFRGEALASISAVATLTIISKEQNTKKGYKLSVDGEKVNIEQTASKQGTQVIIENIFNKTPARLKFLKSDTTEQRHCIDTLTQLVLANPQIAFTLIVNGKTKFVLPQNQQIIDRIKILFGKNISSNLINIFCDHPHIKIKGFVGKPQLSGKNTQQFISVNKRPITNKIVASAIKQAYSNLIMPSLKPTYFIYIQTPIDFVDVNTHPQKKELKFLNPNLIYTLTKDAVSKALQKTDLTVRGVDNLYKSQLSENLENKPIKNTKSNYNYTKIKTNSLDNFYVAEKPIIQQNSLDKSEFYKNILSEKDTEYFVINNLYIVVKTEQGIEILDQHATHERILYNKLKQSLQNKQVQKQKLLIPEQLQLQTSLLSLFEENIKILEDIGYEFEKTRKGYNVIAKPTYINNDPNTYITEVITALNDTSDFNIIDDKTDRKLATLACKGAVKAGDKLSASEINNLISTLNTFDDKYTCPHGRPVKVNLTFNDMNRMFKRQL